MVQDSADADERPVEQEMSIPPLEGWVTATDASIQLGLTRQSINKKIRSGLFEGARTIGNIYVLPEESVNSEKTRRHDAEELTEG